MTDVYVCTKCKRSSCVIEPLKSHTDAKVHTVGCQKVCEAPVAGLMVNGRMEWFERLDKAKPIAGLVTLVKAGGKGKPAKPLAKRRSKKRSGRDPR